MNQRQIKTKMRATSAQLLLHLAGAGSFAYAIYYDLTEVHLPAELTPASQRFGGQAKYLTFLNMLLQLLYFSVCLLADFSRAESPVCRLRHMLFATAAFPIGIFVGVIFWSIWAVDRELVFSARLDPYFPSWLNHLMHTTVMPLQLGELALCRHTYPGWRLGYTVTALLTLAYLIWLHVIFYVGGFWVYPVFKVLSPVTRSIFMFFCCALGGCFYFLGQILNDIIWSPKRADLGKTIKKKLEKKAA